MKKFCNSCGNALSETDKFCTSCGQKVEINKESKELQQEETLNEKLETNESINVEQVNIDLDDRLDGGLKVLSFCLPIVGIVLYFSNKNLKPKKAESACHSSLWGWAFSIVLVIILTIFSIFYKEIVGDTLSQEDIESINSVDSTFKKTDSSAALIDSATAKISDEDSDYQLEIMDSRSKSYHCRQCGRSISWIGSYYWTSYLDDNGSIKNDITKLENLEYAGDERIDTPMYTDAGLISRGIFCSERCTRKNLSTWTFPEDYKQYIEQ
ncbi:zinc ribbon domain-containing protein [Epilithonimonas caeni]|uniref:zinc ribbon domain-containing protein n=1 Tax=Epilithonimonas caeni TaxID=365343 RepID=UPI0003FB3DCD|nr:zinc ribbon domain-containing protein [Epilithonimonas caeni]